MVTYWLIGYFASTTSGTWWEPRLLPVS
jgi:hypothetical protein